MVIIYTDTMNCYDRVVYLFTSLSAQYFGLDVTYLLVLFGIIKLIKIYLCMLFKVLRQFCTRDNCQLFQGVDQSNSIALSLQLIIAIILVRYVCSRRVAAQIIALILNAIILLAALLYPDDTDLYVFNQGMESIEKIVRKIQALLVAQYKVLKIIEDDLKLLKYYQIM